MTVLKLCLMYTIFAEQRATARLVLRSRKRNAGKVETVSAERKAQLDDNISYFLQNAKLQSELEAQIVLNRIEKYLDTREVSQIAAISRQTASAASTTDAADPYASLPAGVIRPDKMMDAEFTSCGWGGNCKPEFAKLTTQQKYMYLGAHWQFPKGVTKNAEPVIPRVVHYVLSDRRTRNFDWTCYLSVKAAMHHIKPDKIVFHVYESVEPFGEWWQLTKSLGVEIVPFTKQDVPQELNGIKVTIPAHIADFRRFQILRDQGGIYMDTDHIMLKPIGDLLYYNSVWGRQALNENGHQVAIGCMMTSPKGDLFSKLYEQMKKVYTGGWATHSIAMVDAYFKKHSDIEGNLILPYGALYPFSWQRGDLCCDYYYHKDMDPTSLTEGKGFDWSGAYSFHLFHSQSGSFIQPMEPSQLRDNTNVAVAIRKALSKEDLDKLFSLLEKYPYDNKEVKRQTSAAKKVLGIKDDP